MPRPRGRKVRGACAHPTRIAAMVKTKPSREAAKVGTSVFGRAVRAVPDLEVLVAHHRIERVSELGRQLGVTDQLLNIGEVLQSIGGSSLARTRGPTHRPDGRLLTGL